MIRGFTAVDVIAPKADDGTLVLGLMLSIALFPFRRGLPIRRLRRPSGASYYCSACCGAVWSARNRQPGI